MNQLLDGQDGREPSHKSVWRARLLRDRVIVPFLFFVGLAFAAVYLFQFHAPDWYVMRSTTGSRSFTTAAMVGLGHGFGQPAVVSEELDQFLWQKKMTLLPADVPADMELLPPNNWELRHRYLLTFVGMVWRVTGPSWPVVKVLLAVAFGLVLVLAYGLLRQGMRPALAFVLALGYVTTPGWLLEISSVRDFLKVPFLLAVFLLIAYVLRQKPAKWRLFACAVALGVLIGVGVGFRHDVIVCIPPVILLLAIPTGGAWRRALPGRGIALLLFIASFWLIAAPILSAYDSSGAPAHDAIMGLTPRNEDNIGLDRGFYDRFPSNIDNLVHAVEMGYAKRMLPEQGPMRYDDAAAEAVGKEMLWTMAHRFPADFLARTYAAVLWVLEGGCPQHTYAADSVIQRPFNRWVMVPLALVTMTLLLIHNLRVALLATIIFLYFCAYVTLQFEHRHTYHLAIFSLWILGFLADQFVNARHAHGSVAGAMRQVDKRRLFSAGAASLAVLVLFVVALGAARFYQSIIAPSWLAPYEQASTTPLATTACASKGWVFFRASGHSLADQLGNGWFYTERYLMAELTGSTEMRPFFLVYRKSPQSGIDFNDCLYTPATPEGEAGALQVFFPVYAAGEMPEMLQMEFAGIAMLEEDADDFQGLYHVDRQDAFDLMPVVWLPKDRDLFVPYQRLREPRILSGTHWLNPLELDCEGLTLKTHILQ